MDNQSLSYKTLKNSAWGFLGYVIPILFSIVVTPVIIHKLGIVDYGVFVLANTIIAFLSLLDFGFTISLIKYASENYAKGEISELNSLLNAGHSLYLAIGVVGFVVFYLVGTFFLPIFKISGSSVSHIGIVFLLAGLTFFFSSLLSVYQVVPHALQRFDVTTKLTTSQLIIGQIATLIAVLLGYKLKVMFLISLVTTIGLFLGYKWFCKRLLPQAEFGFSLNRQALKKIFYFGGFAALNNISSSALIQLDRLIIPILLGPAQLSYYSVPGGAVTKIPGFTSSFSGIFFPLSSSMQSLGEMDRLKVVYIKAFRNLSVLAAALTFALVIFARKILYFWIGPEFAENSTEILVILALTHYVLALYAPLTNFLLGLGKLKILAFNSVVLAIINLILLVILIPKMGIIGAAWAYLISVLPMVFIFYWTEKKVLFLSGITKFYLRLYAKLICTAAVSFVIVKFLLLPLTVSIQTLVVFGPLSILIFLSVYKLLGFVDQEDWDLAKGFASQALVRLGLKNAKVD